MRSTIWSCAAIVLACGCASPPADDAADVHLTPPNAPSEVGRTGSRPGTTTKSHEIAPSDASGPTAPAEVGEAPHTVAPPPVTTPHDVLPSSHVAAAVAVVQERGYTPISTADIEGPPAGGLHVIIAESTDLPHDRQRAFFFIGDGFVGNDLEEPSASIEFAWRSADTIALAYAVYRPNDRSCCPTGGAMNVRYRWTGLEIGALDPVPTAAERR